MGIFRKISKHKPGPTMFDGIFKSVPNYFHDAYV